MGLNLRRLLVLALEQQLQGRPLEQPQLQEQRAEQLFRRGMNLVIQRRLFMLLESDRLKSASHQHLKLLLESFSQRLTKTKEHVLFQLIKIRQEVLCT